jgi:transcriptional regulator with XRE-family HTH domain
VDNYPMSASIILGRSRNDILADAGTALLQVKNARGLTLEEMGAQMHRTRESVSQYIAGEAEMGFITWERALDAWPELAARIAETAADRAARAKQRPLDLDLPTRKERAA